MEWSEYVLWLMVAITQLIAARAIVSVRAREASNRKLISLSAARIHDLQRGMTKVSHVANQARETARSIHSRIYGD